MYSYLFIDFSMFIYLYKGTLDFTMRKNFKGIYIFNILLKCHFCSIYNKYNHILYVLMHT